VLDILAKDQDDHILNVEMQMSRQQAWSERSMVYLAKMLAGQLKAGDQYANLKPVIGIHFLAYDLFEAQNQAIWCFEMRDRNLPAVRLGRELQLNIVELKKAARLTRNASSSNQADTALSAWIKYFAFWKDETIMNQIAHPPVLEAMQGLRALSADEEARRMADVRERAILAERTEIESALARGKAIGKAEGKAEGKVEAKLEALAAMIASGIGEAQAKAILGMA
jgi:predicted transposase/invertase (TIGR01784 family)